MMNLVLYTATTCPKCPKARETVREVAKTLGWVEGRDFIEKLIDGENIKTEQVMELEGKPYHIVQDASKITPQTAPCALAGKDFFIEALTLNIASVPSLVLADGTIYRGELPQKDQLIEKIRNMKV
ncbi:MAG: hypothetical protein QXU82_00585 [Candidatus Aenigmatarchaeota archaeon]